MPKKQTQNFADLLGVPIFAAGTWNGDKWSVEDLEEIASNTNKLLESELRHRPPVKLGHSEKQILKGQSDGQPALGWVENLRVEGKKLIGDVMNVPSVLAKAIKEGLWRNVSVELRNLDHTGWTLRGLALLGADLPAVKTLDDLAQFLPENLSDDVPCDIVLAFSEPSVTDEVKMAEEKKLAEEKAELERKYADLQKQMEQMKADAEAKEKADAKARVEARFEEQKKAVLSELDQWVKEGKITPAVRDTAPGLLDKQKAAFTETSDLMIPHDLMVAALNSEKLPKGETGGAGQDGSADYSDAPDVELARRATELMEEKNISYTAAAERVMLADPKLAHAYKENPYHEVVTSHVIERG